MPNRMPPSTGYDRSNYQLSRYLLNNPLRDFLADLAVRDRVVLFNDFKDINEVNNWTMAQTQTSVSFTGATDVVGVLAGTAVATTTANISMISKQAWNGNSNVMVEGRFKINTIASTYALEFGLVDGAPATGAAFVTDSDVPSFAGTNGAVFVIDNTQTHTGISFASLGSFTSQTVASTLLTTGFTTPVADTYITAKVLLLTDPDETGKSKAYLWINGKLRASHASAAAGHVNGQGNLYAWFYVKAIAAAAKIATVDYMRISQDRFALNAASE